MGGVSTRFFPTKSIFFEKKKKKTPPGNPQRLKLYILFANIWQECNVPCTFYSYSKLSLVTSTSACYSARNNFCPVREESPQSWNIFVVDVFDFIHAKCANFFSWFSGTFFHSFHGKLNLLHKGELQNS